MDQELVRLLGGAAFVAAVVILYFVQGRQRRSMQRPMVRPAFPTGGPVELHSVIVHLQLSDPEWGTEVDIDRMDELEDALGEAVSRAGVGELDGHEIGQGTCELFLYGPNADAVVRVIAPIVRASAMKKGAWVEKRYGPPGSDAPTARVDLDETQPN